MNIVPVALTGNPSVPCTFSSLISVGIPRTYSTRTRIIVYTFPTTLRVCLLSFSLALPCSFSFNPFCAALGHDSD
ncbi:hypothetical protein GGR50DRAFT_675608 [Xylaria sp. CBS 124048]|nr:hypothetical protein GGR50DRAFT_675608 [Xylaria sp. CBS 124048]